MFRLLTEQDGSAVAVTAVAVAAGLLLATIVLDATAYLAAAARAQAAADGAALAAVAPAAGVGATGAGGAPAAGVGATGAGGAPEQEARRVAHAAGAELVACRCGPTAAQVEVEVAVSVVGIVVPRFGPRRVFAEAAATLVPPNRPGPSRRGRPTPWPQWAPSAVSRIR